jgi:hypothetical protein
MSRQPRAQRRVVAPQASEENRVVNLTTLDDDDKSKDQETPAHRRALARMDGRKTFVGLPDQVARDTLFFGNYKWPGADREYPDEPDAMMRFVTRYYPHAEGGPLYIDQPRSHREVERCEEKRRAFKKLRLRYVVIARAYQTPDGVPVEATNLAEALEQLD